MEHGRPLAPAAAVKAAEKRFFRVCKQCREKHGRATQSVSRAKDARQINPPKALDGGSSVTREGPGGGALSPSLQEKHPIQGRLE